MKRRTFLQAAAGGVAGFSIVPRHVLGGEGVVPPSEMINVAGVGIGGQGGGVIKDMSQHGANIGVLCDLDSKKAAGTIKQYPKAELFKDYRVMLDKMPKSVDAVMVATPDHMHAPITMAAMKAGKAVYVEKPMAHSVEECRVMTAYAKEHNLVTQMGNNGHAGEGLRQTKEWIDAGAIGTVKEVHGWSDRPGIAGKKPWWPQPVDHIETGVPPAELDWDLWIGCAKYRDYSRAYHPTTWRGFFDFGTGALGDMAVHNIDPAFYALELDAPIAAECESSPIGRDSYPAWQVLTMEFAAKGKQPALKIRWYDGGKMPKAPADVEGQFVLPDNGIMFIGDKGTMVCGGWSGAPRLFPAARRKEFAQPEKTIPRSPGHRQEFIQAVKARKPEMAKAGFWYSGPFTEALCIGNLATRLQKRIEWDAASMRAKNAPEADGLIRKTYRAGFGL